mmetsp:Transcript_54899/g.146591  ORF Transcript_54899/g.146591 Transcript_54899/m.146591 type:complete len:314 (-) Transcript_54899:334-1275(-)
MEDGRCGSGRVSIHGVSWRSGAYLLKEAGLVEIRPGRKLRVLHQRPKHPDLPAPCVLFVHGSAASMTHLLPTASTLLQEDNYGIVLYDWFGCGESPKPRKWSAYQPDELQADLMEVWRRYFCEGRGKMGTTGPCFIVAHSFGAHFTMRLALQLQEDPELRKPDGVILLSAARKFPEGHPLFLLPSSALWCLQPMLSKALMPTAFTSEADPELLKEMRASSGRNDMYMCKAYYRQIKNLPEEVLRRVPTRALVVHGILDGIVSAEEAEALASALPGSGEVLTLQDLSHNFMLERPDLVVNLVRDFVTTFSQSTG